MSMVCGSSLTPNVMQINEVLTILKMRNRAINILEDEMSENTLRHIREIDYLEDWIVDAMIRFHESELKNFHLSDVISSVCGKHCDELRTACDKRK